LNKLQGDHASSEHFSPLPSLVFSLFPQITLPSYHTFIILSVSSSHPMARYTLSTLLAVALLSSSTVWAQAPAAATPPPAAADPAAPAVVAAAPTAPPAAAAPATDAPVATPLASKHFDYPAGIVRYSYFTCRASYSTTPSAIPS
jgi:hypothetical protein